MPGGDGAKAQRTVGLEWRKQEERSERGGREVTGTVALGLAATGEMGAIQRVAGSLSRLWGRGTSWGRKSHEVGAGVIERQ